MLETFILRPTLTNPSLLARTLERIGTEATSQAEIWHRLTERYAVDLDAVAKLLPKSEPEPIWLPTRRGPDTPTMRHASHARRISTI